LTTGYENLSNLQLYKVNGIAILNLKHLASVLDLITGPLIAKSNGNQNHNITCKDLPESFSASVDLGCSENDKTCHALHERERAQIGEEDCTMKSQREVVLQGDTVSTTCESRSSTKERPGALNIIPASGAVVGSEKVSTGEAAFSQIPNLCEGNIGLEEDPTLLCRDDYLHFELDKDKIIVLHILSACMLSPDILKQYAIGQSRSEDLVAKTILVN